MSEANTQPKAGWKTTEFWLSFGAILIGAVMASGILDGFGRDHWAVRAVGLVASVLAALGYTAARGMVKANGNRNKAIAEIAATGLQPRDP